MPRPTPPTLLLALVVGSLPAIAAAQPERPAVLRVASDAELTAEVERYVGGLAGSDLFSGAVLVARNGKTLLAKAYGMANKDFDAPNRLDTRFNLGSMNKMFTAVAVAQLVERGKLSFDDPLSRFLPDFPTAEAAKKIRIKHLLSHTAGLGSYFNDEFDRSSRALYRTVDDMMRLAQGDSLAFEPGTRWSYSNTGMLVLGKVIEMASGQDYFSYIREHVYRPAGMTRSDSYELDYVNSNLAVGYDKEYQEDGSVRFRNNIFQHVIRGGPAGGGYSTVEDLARFAEALTAGKLVGPKYLEQLITAKPDLNSPSYGYGFGVSSADGIVGHSGGFPGISSNLDIFTGSGYVAVVQSNYGRASAPVSQRMRALIQARTSASILGASPAAAQSAAGVPQLGWMAGCWEMRSGLRVTHEQWMAPLGGMMLGMSRTVIGDSARAFEHLRIESRGGRVSYVTHPSGQAEAAFGAASTSDTLVVFSNPDHDFPQRIIYRRQGADTLLARIEGDRNGQVTGVDFPMRRVGCGG